MKKRLIALLLAGVMVFSCTACGNTAGTQQNTQEDSQTNKVEIKNPTELLGKVWETYGEEEKFYGIGGDYENIVEDAPGKFDITDTESLESRLCFPAENVSYISEAASLFHGLNANNFSGAAYHVKEVSNLSIVVDGIKERTLNNRWMCGFPETLLIMTIGDNYVVSAFGSADIIDLFKTKVTDVYGDIAKVAIEQSLE